MVGPRLFAFAEGGLAERLVGLRGLVEVAIRHGMEGAGRAEAQSAKIERNRLVSYDLAAFLC